MEEFLNSLAEATSLPLWAVFGLVLALTFWSLAWKGIALWKAARLSQKIWFIALLVVNTIGILEIIYIFTVVRKSERTKSEIGQSTYSDKSREMKS
jgi:hypothetical protein